MHQPGYTRAQPRRTAVADVAEALDGRRTRAAISGATLALPFSTFETVATETPASAATDRIDGPYPFTGVPPFFRRSGRHRRGRARVNRDCRPPFGCGLRHLDRLQFRGGTPAMVRTTASASPMPAARKSSRTTSISAGTCA